MYLVNILLICVFFIFLLDWIVLVWVNSGMIIVMLLSLVFRCMFGVWLRKLF